MSDNSQDNKRLAKNTLFLYFRMFLTLLVGLYTSRVVLNVLGVVDYGINNVVGGIVTIFASLNGAMASTSSRYITFYLGKGDNNRLREIFSTVAFVHIGIAILVILLCETIGLWFFYNKMQIPCSSHGCRILATTIFICEFFSKHDQYSFYRLNHCA